MLYDIISYHLSYHIISHIISYLISYHIISNIISYHIIYIYHTISDRHRVDQILRAAYVTQTSVAKLSGAEDAESEKPKVGDPEVRKVHFET